MSIDKYISSVHEFIELVDNLDTKNPYIPFSQNPIEELHLYRGHSDCNWELLPSIRRKVRNVFNGNTYENHEFGVFSSEKGILLNFIQEALPYVKYIDEKDYLKWTILAQHYGMPTRLLDWTSNPLIALFFACASNNNVDGRVWICQVPEYQSHFREAYKEIIETSNKMGEKTVKDLADELLFNTVNYYKEGENHPDIPVLLNPYYLDLRMAMQASRFMMWSETEKPLEEMVPVGNLNHNTKEEMKKTVLWAVGIKSTDKQKLIRQLEKLGISAKTVYPGLDGVGSYIKRKYQFDYQEAVDAF